MNSEIINTIIGVGVPLITAIVILIIAVIRGDKNISKDNGEEHAKQNNEHTQIITNQSSYIKTINTTNDIATNIDKTLAILKDRDDQKASLVSKNVENSLISVSNSFVEQAEKIQELIDKNVKLKKEVAFWKTKINDLQKENDNLQSKLNKLDGPTFGRT